MRVFAASPDQASDSFEPGSFTALDTDGPREFRGTDLRRHLRFWEVAPDAVPAPPHDPQRPAARYDGTAWEWASDEPDAAGDPGGAWSSPIPPTAIAGRPLLARDAPRFGTLAELRAERRELQRRVHAMQLDLGGLHVEMARAASVDHALLEARALELVTAGDRLVALERAMDARRRGEDPSWAALMPCSSCGAPRPHDASFCPYCGSSVTPARTWGPR